MKNLIIAAFSLTLIAGAASAQALPDGKGNSAGGYKGDMERRLGVDPRGAVGQPDPALNPVLTGALSGSAYATGTLPSGKGNEAGGYRGELARRTGTDPSGTTMPSDPARDPRVTGSIGGPNYLPGTLPDGKGNSGGGYNGEVGRRLGIGN